MKSMFKKTLSIMLCVILVLSSASFAFAGELPEDAFADAELSVGDEYEDLPFEPADPGAEEPEEPEELEEPEPETPGETDPEDPDAEDEAEGSKHMKETPEGPDLPGMPEGYVLSADEIDKKRELSTYGVAEGLAEIKAGEDYVEGEAVLLSDSREYAELVAAAYGGELSSYGNGVAVIALPDEVSTFEAVTAAADLSLDIPAVFPNFIYRLPEPVIEKEKTPAAMSAFSNEAPRKQVWSEEFEDPFLKEPNAGNDSYQWFHDAIGTYAAWGTTMGAGITVAVLDTGVQSDHEDLESVLPGENTLTGVSSGTSEDDHGHGTHVAGIIAASANDKGGRGVAPEVNILPVKVLNNIGRGTTFEIIDGINWVVNSGDSRRADIINMSLGGFAFEFDEFDILYRDATAAAINDGIVVVAAAGNDGTNNRVVPADYPGVICVAATEMTGQRSFFSNYGPQVTIAAPGSEILSTIPGVKKYDAFSGTSMAAPIVSGAIALYLSQMEKLPGNAADVAAVTRAIVRLATPASSPQIGRIVNVGNMFDSITVTPTFSVSSGGKILDDLRAPIPNDKVTVTIHGSNFIVYTTDGSAPQIRNGIVTNGKSDKGDSVTLEISPDQLGRVTIRALCVNGQGRASRAATLTFNLVPTPGGAETTGGMSDISGPLYLGAGRSARYSAAVLATAGSSTSRSIVWSVEIGNATIKSNGTLTIRADAEGGSEVIIVARAKGSKPGDCESIFTVIVTPPIQSVSVSVPSGITQLVAGGPKGEAKSCDMLLTIVLQDRSVLENPEAGDYVAWRSSNTKIATVDAKGVVTAVGSGRATITARATDGSGRSGTVTVTCVLPATGVVITGATEQRAAGSRLTLRAATVPSKPTTRGVNWSVSVDPEIEDPGVSISSAGRLTIPAEFTENYTITVTATARDGYGAEDSVIIEVVERRASAVRISTEDKSGRATKNKAGRITAVALFTLNPPTPTEFDIRVGGPEALKDAVLENLITLDGDAGGNKVGWRSSNTRVATVDEIGNVAAVGSGRATITCTASDGSGRRATLTVNVRIPASSAWVQGRKMLAIYNSPFLAFGRSLQMRAQLNSAYGRVSNTRVRWTYEVLLYGSPNNDFISFVSVSSSGRLSVKRQLQNRLGYDVYNCAVRVTATALDGSGVSGSIDVYLCPPTTRLSFDSKSYTLDVGGDYGIPFLSNSTYWIFNDGAGNQFLMGDFIVTSSNPRVLAVFSYCYYDGEFEGLNVFRVEASALTRGKATLRVVANDGSGRSATVKITVK